MNTHQGPTCIIGRPGITNARAYHGLVRRFTQANTESGEKLRAILLSFNRQLRSGFPSFRSFFYITQLYFYTTQTSAIDKISRSHLFAYQTHPKSWHPPEPCHGRSPLSPGLSPRHLTEQFHDGLAHSAQSDPSFPLSPPSRDQLRSDSALKLPHQASPVSAAASEPSSSRPRVPRIRMPSSSYRTIALSPKSSLHLLSSTSTLERRSPPRTPHHSPPSS
jgi:hypothetical protein